MQRSWRALRPTIGSRFNFQIRSLFVQTEPTPNSDSLKFLPGIAVLHQQKDQQGPSSIEFLNPREALVSPLATALFRIKGIRAVFFGPDFITVTKEPETQWPILKPDVFGSIMDFYASKQDILRDLKNADGSPDSSGMYAQDTRILPEDDEVVATIKELIATRIRPTIMEDGGDLEFCGFENGVVKLKLKGACRTCDSSTITLKNGIENMLMVCI
jgi:Fe-S cluster biogenesis protein NfuA